jgi:hypothetical protein
MCLGAGCYHRRTARASGGIGRRAGFRFLCPKGRGGSTPPSPTTCDLVERSGSDAPSPGLRAPPLGLGPPGELILAPPEVLLLMRTGFGSRFC